MNEAIAIAAGKAQSITLGGTDIHPIPCYCIGLVRPGCHPKKWIPVHFLISNQDF